LRSRDEASEQADEKSTKPNTKRALTHLRIFGRGGHGALGDGREGGGDEERAARRDEGGESGGEGSTRGHSHPSHALSNDDHLPYPWTISINGLHSLTAPHEKRASSV